MIKINKLFYFLSSLSLLSTTYTHAQGDKVFQAPVAIPSSIAHNSTSRRITSLDYSLNAVLWQQHSGEYKALCYQAFALAKMRLMEKIAAHKKDEAPLAIITHIDETVLDNSPQQAADILAGTTYAEKAGRPGRARPQQKLYPVL